ncbi:MAG: hypothetical protein AMS22_06730 [Thiotrichales bacterium SG8_50]|nr:MAG: hypothetical protein AMS22_06730 [Thiotrichales bacterium SG8_50]
MAVVAIVATADVRRVFARRDSAVVAAEAIPGDVAVVEHGRYPRRGLVAVVALIAGLDVSRRLPGCDQAGVAIHTAAGNGGMVHVRDGAPRRRGVAVGTNFGTGDVIDGFCRRLHSSDRRMTADTGRIRALEFAARVAAVAAHVGMSAIELEPGTEVIEGLLRRRL